MGQYTSSPGRSIGRRGYCCAELTVFFLPSGMDGQAELPWWLVTKWVSLPARRQSPIPLLTGLKVEQLRWSRRTSYRYTKNTQKCHRCLVTMLLQRWCVVHKKTYTYSFSAALPFSSAPTYYWLRDKIKLRDTDCYMSMHLWYLTDLGMLCFWSESSKLQMSNYLSISNFKLQITGHFFVKMNKFNSVYFSVVKSLTDAVASYLVHVETIQ